MSSVQPVLSEAAAAPQAAAPAPGRLCGGWNGATASTCALVQHPSRKGAGG